MSKSTVNVGKKITVLYGVAVLCMCFMVLWTVLEHWSDPVRYGLGDSVDISQAFTIAEGEPVDFQALDQYGDSAIGRVSVYYDFDTEEQEAGLVYRSQNAYTEVFVNGELVYHTQYRRSRFFNVAFGSRWNVVHISPDVVEGTLELRITPAYEGGWQQIDHIYWGDPAASILTVIRDKIPATVISLFMCLLGLFLIILDVPLNMNQSKKIHSMLYLGFFALVVGGWCLTETNILPFLGGDVQAMQMLDNMLVIISVIPLFLYLDSIYDVFKYPAMKIVCYLDLVFLFVCVILPLFGALGWHGVLPLLGTADWHGVLPIARVYLGICAILFILWVRLENRKLRRAGKRSISGMVQLIGIDVLGISLVVELVRYYVFSQMDKASVMRVGLLLFIICFGISSQMRTLQLVTQGREYDFVRNLAYSDGLTGVGNRTAYLEQLDVFVEEETPQLGIVFLDVNNLKKVNDNLGHEVGDELIRAAAEAVKNSFGVYGKIYRIGGDEFCVLIANKNAKWMFDEAEKKFLQCVSDVNEKKVHPFYLQIAYGFACCQVSGREVLDVTVKEADEQMYLRKAQMKAEA